MVLITIVTGAHKPTYGGHIVGEPYDLWLFTGILSIVDHHQKGGQDDALRLIGSRLIEAPGMQWRRCMMRFSIGFP